ncbi:protein-l-isoaspartate(d-aspartate) o-methyltransferase [Anaeramoeba ignava]|uniref:protein-L-isoaspartate(D-aspartate) O-methyltransferase n=1 Tax=Anaeramoeba ignava TaxID=1746090 RepID=A0A9Q0LGU5_ANAIG|nr:protein-l-isoaspartate(d-aspartate) o-methyltransferase [Anaeramoeba ignava]
MEKEKRKPNKKLKKLIKKLIKEGRIKTEKVKKAMLKVDRANFFPEKSKNSAYEDHAHSIGFSATISAPHMHAMQLELMQLEQGFNVLDIGSGSGIICAYAGKIIGDAGKIIGIEHIEKLANWSIENIKKDSPDLIEKGIANIVVGDGFLGCKDQVFDAIHVGAAAPSIPQSLVEQLKIGGHLVIPIGNPKSRQKLFDITKKENGEIVKTFVSNVRFVPLCKKEEQLKKKDD